MFTVKSSDTEVAAPEMYPPLPDDIPIISIRKGLDNEEKLAATI